jgi:hypothetical protein
MTLHRSLPTRLPATLAVLLAAFGLVLGACSPAPSSVAQVHLTGRATAGPVCPVERVPPDPNCAPRPVAGAVLAIVTVAGAEVGQARTAADGSFAFDVPEGDYRLVPQRVEGLLGTAPSIEFSVRVGGPQPAPFDVLYDTGIR